MKPHPAPTVEGYRWAKLVHPNKMPPGEDWASPDWEIVRVVDNNGAGEDQFRVAVMGIEPGQLIDGFIWGPPVPPMQQR